MVTWEPSQSTILAHYLGRERLELIIFEGETLQSLPSEANPSLALPAFLTTWSREHDSSCLSAYLRPGRARQTASMPVRARNASTRKLTTLSHSRSRGREKCGLERQTIYRLSRQDKQLARRFLEQAKAEQAKNAPSQELGGGLCLHNAG